TITTVNPLPAGLGGPYATVNITGVQGFNAANGIFAITVTGSNSFQLNGTMGTVGNSTANTGTWAPDIIRIGANSDSLVNIGFHLQAGAALGSSAINLVSS